MIDRVEWLRSKKAHLIEQVAAVDTQLASLRGYRDIPGFSGGRQAWPPRETGAGGGPPFGGGAIEEVPGVGAGGSHWEGVGAGGTYVGGGLGVGRRPEGGRGGAGGAGIASGASGHFILGLSTEAFGSTPVDQVRFCCCCCCIFCGQSGDAVVAGGVLVPGGGHSYQDQILRVNIGTVHAFWVYCRF